MFLNFNNYHNFKELPSYFAAIDCNVFSKEKCKLFEDCKVRDFHKQKMSNFALNVKIFLVIMLNLTNISINVWLQ